MLGTATGKDAVRVKIPLAIDRALQKAFPSAEHGFAEYRVHQALLAFLRGRGIEITAEIAATTSKRTPARSAPRTSRRRPMRSGSRRRRR